MLKCELLVKHDAKFVLECCLLLEPLGLHGLRVPPEVPSNLYSRVYVQLKQVLHRGNLLDHSRSDIVQSHLFNRLSLDFDFFVDHVVLCGRFPVHLFFAPLHVRNNL